MRIKSLFSIPDGEKVTDKALRRVLISSICSILLCMTCLVSTTWAWFTVSIENWGNVIQIAEVTAAIDIRNYDNTVLNSLSDGQNCALGVGTYTISVQVVNNASEIDDLNRSQRIVYVLMNVSHDNGNENETKCYYFAFDGTNGNKKELNGFQVGSGSATVSFSVSWVQPAAATPVGDVPIGIGEISTEPPTEESTSEPTETPTEAPTTESTQAPTEESTTPPTTAPSTEPSVPDDTDPATEPPTPSETEPSTDQTQE